MRNTRAFLIATGLLALVLPACDSAEKKEAKTVEQTPKSRLSVERSIEVAVTAKVKAINHVTRVATLTDAKGNEVTFVVDRSVKRLDEVNVGDNVNARYEAALLAELRPATAQEASHPISVVDGGGRSPQGSAPGATSSQAVKVVTTVEAVDVPNMYVTLRGPMGDTARVRGRKAENLKRLKVGDTIVLTFTETVAVVLDKAD